MLERVSSLRPPTISARKEPANNPALDAISLHKQQGVYEKASAHIKNGLDQRILTPIATRNDFLTLIRQSPEAEIAANDIFLLAGGKEFPDVPPLEDFFVINEPYTGADGIIRKPLPKYVPKTSHPHLLAMQEAYKRFLAESGNVNRPGLIVESGYRSPYYQVGLMIREMTAADPYEVLERLMIPGKSQHENYIHGAVDIMNVGDGQGVLEDPKDNKVGFENTQEFMWLLNNSFKFGFWLPYFPDTHDLLKPTDKDGVLIEPWHFQYHEDAQRLTEQYKVREAFLERKDLMHLLKS